MAEVAVFGRQQRCGSYAGGYIEARLMPLDPERVEEWHRLETESYVELKYNTTPSVELETPNNPTGQQLHLP